MCERGERVRGRESEGREGVCVVEMARGGESVGGETRVRGRECVREDGECEGDRERDSV